MNEEPSLMPSKKNKDEWNALIARYRTMCYGCGKQIKVTDAIMNHKGYKVSMHLGCYTKHIRGEDVQG